METAPDATHAVAIGRTALTLSGKLLWVSLGAAALAGGVGGTFLGGWRSTRGLPPLSVVADAGVSVSVDAGTSAKSDCGAVIEHWTTVNVPGPVRYFVLDGGTVVERPSQPTIILVPDVRLTSHTESVATLTTTETAEASAVARVDVPRAAPELPRGSLQALATLDTKGQWGGEVGVGVRVLEKWWLVTGVQWTPGDAVRGGLGVRKDF